MLSRTWRIAQPDTGVRVREKRVGETVQHETGDTNCFKHLGRLVERLELNRQLKAQKAGQVIEDVEREKVVKKGSDREKGREGMGTLLVYLKVFKALLMARAGRRDKAEADGERVLGGWQAVGGRRSMSTPSKQSVLKYKAASLNVKSCLWQTVGRTAIATTSAQPRLQPLKTTKTHRQARARLLKYRTKNIQKYQKNKKINK